KVVFGSLVAGLLAGSSSVAMASGDTTEPPTETTTDDAAAASGPVCETSTTDDDIVEAIGDIDLSGVEVTIGSKNFTEQYVLGWLGYLAMEEAGATVDEAIDLGGTNVVREALLAGEIDMSWEYNGTGWAEHLGQADPSFVPETLTAEVCALDLEENDMRWIGRSPFNNTYGFASRPDLVDDDGEPLDFDGMAAYLEENPDATVCMESEFPARDDGLVLWEDHTGYVLPVEQEVILDTDVIYEQTASGECDFGEIFTTDERVNTLGLNLVADPGVMILYNVSLTMTDETYQQAPDAFRSIAATLLADLDEETMLELNGAAAETGDPEQVARDYLVEQGLIEE
ncbi:MAG: glycine betaine ABC transporter substrate-binding protein, partial [Desertimonas sp.]